MKKIVRGKIKSIDTVIGKKEDSCEGEEVECIEYRIILENDSNKYITRSSLGFKEGSIVDICFNEDKKNKDNTRNGIIINKKVSQKLLGQFKGIKITRWICYPLLSCFFAVFTYVISSSNIPMDLFSWVLCGVIALLYMVFIACIEDSYNKIKLSKEDKKVLEQYKKDFRIENEESLDKVKQVKVV